MGGSIVLVGFMGAGKTTVGSALAKRLGFQFLDTDETIRREAGRSVPEIFRIEGEAGFRRREAEVISRLPEMEGWVVATGGGAPCSAENAAALKKTGPVVHLDLDLDTVRERTRRTSHRPLLAGDDEDLAALLTQRRAVYAQIADLTVDVRGKDPGTIVEEICRELL